VELLPTWLLAKLAGDTIGRKLEMRKLFEDYLKEGGNIEAFLTEIFKRKSQVTKTQPRRTKELNQIDAIPRTPCGI
jgi:hypothetical protein